MSSCRRATISAIWLLPLFAALAAADDSPASTAAPPTPILTSFDDIRALTPQATRHQAVQIQGVVTYERSANRYYLSDDSGDGLLVTPALGEKAPEVGERVEVTGEVGPGRYVPIIEEARVLHSVPAAAWPAGRPTSYDQIVSGRWDAQLIELRGVVRTLSEETNRFRLIVGTGRGRVLVEIPRRSGTLLPEDLEDAAVKLLGICENTYDERQHLRGLRILLADPSRLTVEEPAIPASELPERKINSLLRFSTDDRPEHRIRLRGTVTYCLPSRQVFLQDETGGVLVRTLDPIVLKPGAEVELLAYPVLDKWIPHLRDGAFRLLRSGTAPAILPLTATEALATNHNAELLALDGRLLNHVARAGEWTLFLQDGNTVFTASLEQKRSPEFPWLDGSRLRLTGVCTVSADTIGRLRNLNLLLRTPDDAEVIALPTWWTLERALAVVGALLCAGLASLVWGATLRRRVGRQSTALRERLAREAALQTKYRELFETASDPVFTTDLASRFLSFNRAAELATGRTQAEAAGARLADWVAPAHAPRLQEWLALAAGTEAPLRLEMEIRTKDGRPAILDISAVRILQDGQATALQCLARDITERKEAETALAQAHRQLEATHGELRQLHEQLEKIHASLAREIAERQRAQAELERVHKQLLTTAREAGMAEVSTGVLHNTANVLNSINVSANRVMESLRASRVDNLARVSALVSEHAGDLEDFVNRDEKGRQIGGYLENLAAYLADERKTLLAEFVSLRKNVDHVSIVIATQQNYTTTGGVREQVALVELVQDALKVAEPLFDRHGIVLRREFADLPVADLDRHQVMQVLVNLLRNAAYACAESGREDKTVTVRIAPRDEGRFEVQVADNGIGIPAENLIRVFNQGFTTRKGGHGFGLHSSVLAAQSMQGSLTVHSEGAGLGAVFKLELPLNFIGKEELPA